MTFRFSFFLFSVVFLLAPGHAHADDGSISPFRVEFGLDGKYDDRAIYVVDPAAGKVSRKGDWITESYVTLSYKSRGAYPTKIVFDFTTNHYNRYPVLNYQTYRFRIEQKVGSRTYLTVRYALTPSIYFGDEEVGAPGGNPSPTRDQSYRNQAVQMTLDRDVTRGLNLAASIRFGIRDAGPAFDYRDTTFWGGSLEATRRLNRSLKMELGTTFEWDMARGGNNFFQSTLTNPVPDDASYDQYSLYAGLAYSVSRIASLKGRFTHRERGYTTPRVTDTLHHGRKDHLSGLLLSVMLRLNEAIGLKTSYERVWNDSTKAYARFHENRYAIGLHFRF